ncbi:DUF2268 domain-containing putative Zn-dependent protease [Thioclava sp. 'Guangxiensis']
MTWTIHIANSSGHLDGLVSPIRAAIDRAQARAEAVTETVDLDVVVQAWPGRVIAHLGHAGYAPTADMIQLTFDPANSNCAGNLGEPLERTVVHELHHVLRWRGPGYGRTLGEALVSEGLAGYLRNSSMGGRLKSGSHHSMTKPLRKPQLTQPLLGTMQPTTTPHGFLERTPRGGATPLDMP